MLGTTATQRPALLAVGTVIIVLLTGACAAGGPDASGDVTLGQGDADLTIRATDNDFSPDVAPVPRGESATVTVVNDGDSAHNFVIDELGVSSGTIMPGDAVTATFSVPDGGAEFVCTFHGGMSGRIQASP